MKTGETVEMVTWNGILFVGTTVRFEICIQNESCTHLFTQCQATSCTRLWRSAWVYVFMYSHELRSTYNFCTVLCTRPPEFYVLSVIMTFGFVYHIFYMRPLLWTVSAISLIRCLKLDCIYQCLQFCMKSQGMCGSQYPHCLRAGALILGLFVLEIHHVFHDVSGGFNCH